MLLNYTKSGSRINVQDPDDKTLIGTLLKDGSRGYIFYPVNSERDLTSEEEDDIDETIHLLDRGVMRI